MATLFGTKIKDTYEGVLKLIDNLGLTASPKEITDGAGAGSGVFVANDGSLKASDIHSTVSIQNDGGYKDSTGALGTANQVLSTTGTVTTWVDAEVNTIESITTGEPTGSDQVVNVVSLTQAEYDAGTPIATTFYIIK